MFQALNTALLLGLIGGGMVIVSRNGQGRMASEANASLMGVLITVLVVARMLLPAVMGFLDIDTSSDGPSLCLLYTSPSPRDQRGSRMPSSA